MPNPSSSLARTGIADRIGSGAAAHEAESPFRRGTSSNHNDARRSGRAGRVRCKDTGSVDSGALDATEDAAACRPARPGDTVAHSGSSSKPGGGDADTTHVNLTVSRPVRVLALAGLVLALVGGGYTLLLGRSGSSEPVSIPAPVRPHAASPAVPAAKAPARPAPTKARRPGGEADDRGSEARDGEARDAGSPRQPRRLAPAGTAPVGALPAPDRRRRALQPAGQRRLDRRRRGTRGRRRREGRLPPRQRDEQQGRRDPDRTAPRRRPAPRPRRARLPRARHARVPPRRVPGPRRGRPGGNEREGGPERHAQHAAAATP